MTKNKFLLRKLKQLGRKCGFELINAGNPAEVFSILLGYRGGEMNWAEDRAFLHYCLHAFSKSKAQLFQDMFVLFSLAQKREGFFVEFGATNGVTLSNTCLLERDYGWNGILAEPAKCWHQELRANRSCVIDTRCVWSESGKMLEFNQVADRELSTITRYSDHDKHFAARKHGEIYPVETISLNDLLSEHGAPDRIDYLSVDTEGSEFEILAAFDFGRYDVKIITVEHNFTANRDRIASLLQSQGYSRVLEGFSMWDDWYRKS
jgi:FkbM family methyltransferase